MVSARCRPYSASCFTVKRRASDIRTFVVRDADGSAATLEGPLGKPEYGGDLWDGGQCKGVVQGTKKHLVGEKIARSLHAEEQVVGSACADTLEDRCVDGVGVIVHTGSQMGDEGEMSSSQSNRWLIGVIVITY